MNGHNGRMSFLVDSNIFLRVMVRDDERSWQDCVSFFRHIGEAGINAYIPTLVCAEVYFVLKSFYGYQKTVLVDDLKSMTAVPGLRMYEDISFSLAVDLFDKHNIKFIDCLLASSRRVQEGKAAIVSYDRDFDKLGIRRLEPRDLMKQSSKR